MRRACVIGWPVAHSLSPVIHRYWLKEHGLDGWYDAQPVEPGQAGAFLGSLSTHGFAGCNVTLPHKVAAFDACDMRDEAAMAIGAVNTVWLESGKVCGSNTDSGGFLAHLDASVPDWARGTQTALVIGAGGAARGIVWALQSRGVSDVRIANRTHENAKTLAAAFPPATALDFRDVNRFVPNADLIVNTTSLGMKGCDALDLDLSEAKAGAVVYDIVYNPLETPLLAAARKRGLTCVDGLGMLLHQAAPGFERWFGVRPSVTVALREAVLQALAARER
jgi:shikimate dehydrogenase